MQQYVLEYCKFEMLESVKVVYLSVKIILTCIFMAGWTSFTVCGKLRRLVKVKKVLFHRASVFKFTSPFRLTDLCYCYYYLNLQVGHAGTLDPMATGLLIVCVGKATKLVDR